jgi:hypothetical protein
MSHREIESTPDSFVIGSGRARFEAIRSLSGRWYCHRKVNGRITDDGSYASRRSCRRAILTRIARGDT